jgi:tetratricopeptide (TPR) repeat protein
MQKTKLILKAKAHGAYNKAKKVYNRAVQREDGEGRGRQSERLRDEREMLRGLAELCEALKRALRLSSAERPRRAEALGQLQQLLSKAVPAHADAQPALAALLDAVAAMLEGFHDAVNSTGETVDHLIPTCLDGFLSVSYGEAKNALAHFDRAAKALTDGEARLASLKGQAKPDLAMVGQQEQMVHQLGVELDAAEERAYDTLFRVTSEGEAVLVRALSLYIRSWADYLAGMASSLDAACEVLQQEKAANPSEFAELSLPHTASSGGGGGGGGGVGGVGGSHAPARRVVSTPPGADGSLMPPTHSLSSSDASPVGSPPHRMAVPPPKTGPKQTAFKSKGKGGGGGGGASAKQVEAPPMLGRAPSKPTSHQDGEAALDALLEAEAASSASLSSQGWAVLQPSVPVVLSEQKRPVSRPQSSVFDSAAVLSGSVGSDPGSRKAMGRQRVEKTESSVASAEVNEFTSNTYSSLDAAEARHALPVVHSYLCRCGPKRSVRLTINVETKTFTLSEAMIPDAEFGLAELLQCYKAAKHFTRLVLRFQGRAKERFEFASMDERERCWELVWRMRGIPITSSVTLFATTFNLGEARGPETLENWLPEGYDVYAVGVQECEYIPHRQYNSVEADLFDGIQKHLGPEYIKIAGQSLLSIRLIVMVRRRFASSCTNVKMRKVPCGHLGKVGNKGAVAVAFQLLNSRFCFVTAHLAAHDEKFAERNTDMQNIMLGLKSLVPPGMSPLNYFHALFFFGDLNYRVEMPREQVLTYIENGDSSMLLSRDQLRRAQGEGAAFVGFHEGPITFVPTYRCWRNREGFSDDKMRIPSWTDRVLWRTLPACDVKLGMYSSCPLVLTSDHRPVFAAFQVPLLKPNLPHALEIRCCITLTGLHGSLLGMYQPRSTSVAVFSPNLLDPSFPPESVGSFNAQWGDTIPDICNMLATNPTYVSARHLCLTVRFDRREVFATASLPLAFAIGTGPQQFQLSLLDEKGLPAGTISGVVNVKFSK